MKNYMKQKDKQFKEYNLKPISIEGGVLNSVAKNLPVNFKT